GIKDGQEIVFKETGNRSQSETPGDVIFIIKEKKHQRFVREKDNLVYKVPISLSKALLGTIVKVDTLDGRVLSIPITDIVHPGYEHIVTGEGMPLHVPTNDTNPGSQLDKARKKAQPQQVIDDDLRGERGDLILRFDVVFPEALSAQQKKTLRAANL
ncbi:MAG: putative dnaJ subfamily B member 13, partial [Streblomastix strix]